jgi:hypothetical protein
MLGSNSRGANLAKADTGTMTAKTRKRKHPKKVDGTSPSLSKRPKGPWCTVFGCTKWAQQGGVCCTHGGKKIRAKCSYVDVSQQKHGAFKLETCARAGCNRAVKQHGQHFCDVHLGNGGSKKASKQRDVSANGATRVELETIRGLHKRMNRASLSVRVKQRNRRVAMKQKSSKSTQNQKEWNHGLALQHYPSIAPEF